MTRSRQTNRDSVHGSDDSSDERSPPRGRTGKTSNEEQEVDAQIDAMMGENSKHSGA